MSVIEIGEAQSFPSVLNVRRGPELRRYVPERTCRIVSASEAGRTGYAPACSSCGWQSAAWHQYDYCPHCGAKVEE